MTPEDLIARARRCAASAALLAKDADPNGACNRAYYAMFDAARAALHALDPAVKSETIKTHSGLIAAFSLHLVKPGTIEVEFGRSLRQIDQIRLIADYSDQEIDLDTARTATEQAVRFIEAVERYLAELR